jgi:hypothetical protein
MFFFHIQALVSNDPRSMRSSLFSQSFDHHLSNLLFLLVQRLLTGVFMVRSGKHLAHILAHHRPAPYSKYPCIWNSWSCTSLIASFCLHALRRYDRHIGSIWRLNGSTLRSLHCSSFLPWVIGLRVREDCTPLRYGYSLSFRSICWCVRSG